MADIIDFDPDRRRYVAVRLALQNAIDLMDASEGLTAETDAAIQAIVESAKR